MGHRRDVGAPYDAVDLLLEWSTANFGLIDGAATRSGTNLRTLSFPRYLNFLHHLLIGSAASNEARAKIETMLDWPTDPDEWGLGPDAQAAQERMGALLGDDD